MAKQYYCVLLVALLLTTQVSSQCCVGSTTWCDTTDETECDRASTCEWSTDTDADCWNSVDIPPVDDSGCCYPSNPSSRKAASCYDASDSSCSSMSRMGCNWSSSSDDRCSAPTEAPGCCAGTNSKCVDASASDCAMLAKRSGCSWISGNDADCTPAPPEPGCCYANDGARSADTCYAAGEDESKCTAAARMGCLWMTGEDADCSIPTPEPGCCYGESSNCDTDSESTCLKMARRSGCEWRVGNDENLCKLETPAPTTPAPISGCQNPHRHRKAWQEASDEERQLYIDGFKELNAQGITQQFTQTHLDSSEHSDNAFLPWHREFVFRMENAIRSLGGEFECFVLPYWDWTREPTPKDVRELGDTLFITNSGLGGDSDGACLDDPVWGAGAYTPNGGSCLTRDLDYADEDEVCTFWPPTTMMDLIDYSDQYATFRPYLEGTPHALPHVCIGGDSNTHMATYYSPDDPIFYLHHCFVDFIWALWQDCNDYDGSDVSSWSDEYSDNINKKLDYAPIDATFDFEEPMVHDTFDLAHYDVSYEKGAFFENAGVDMASNCNAAIDSEWFYNAMSADMTAETTYDENSVLAECAAMEGSVQQRGIECCELVQSLTVGGVCEPALSVKDLGVHPQTGAAWKRDTETGDIVITREEMTSSEYGLADCCLAMRSKMFAWALEMNQLEDVQMGCFDPYCNLDDIGQEGYVCFNQNADEIEQETMMATVSRALTSLGSEEVSVGGVVMFGSMTAVAVLMAKHCMAAAKGRGEYEKM